MYSKWLVAVFVSIGLALVNSQSNNGTNVTTSTVNPTTTKLTTTLAPTTSTASPTTSVPTTSSKPTVAPSPPPIPKPEAWNGTVTDQNKTCINARFSVQIDISYNTTNNTQFLTGFTVPSDASVDQLNSHCSQNESEPQTLAITFANGKEEPTSANLTLVFNNTDHEVRVQTVKLSFVLTQELFPQFHDPNLYNTTVTFEKSDLSLFKVASAHSYLCKAPQSADLGSHETGINDVKMDFIDSKVEAYIGESNKGAFDSEIDCKSTEISDVVPIAVGAALAGLVVIVLIAYFIGRRRSRRLAYQSV